MTKISKSRKNPRKRKEVRVSPGALREILSDATESFSVRLGIEPELARRYQSTLIRLLSHFDDDEPKPKPPDYSKEGSTGALTEPNIAFLWLGPEKGWVRIPLKKPASDCAPIVVEASCFEEADPCPSKDGFQSLVDFAEDKAKDFARQLTCPDDECPGRYIYVNYRNWHCEKDKKQAVATVQVSRLCGII